MQKLSFTEHSKFWPFHADKYQKIMYLHINTITIYIIFFPAACSNYKLLTDSWRRINGLGNKNKNLAHNLPEVDIVVSYLFPKFEETTLVESGRTALDETALCEDRGITVV